MTLTALSSANLGFYTPAFDVRLAGKSLVLGLGIAVSQAEVDLSLSAAGRFSFTVVGTFDARARDFFSTQRKRVLDLLTFGAPIIVAMGYGGRADLRPMIHGIVTEITTRFSEGGDPELQVSGYDHLFRATLGKRSDSWPNVTDSDVVSTLASRYNLGADVDSTTERHAQIEQNQESDFEFIKKLAERNHYEFYVDDARRLHFGRPLDLKQDVVSLDWGRELLGFSPEANLANQVSRVDVYGWDPRKKQPIVGTATAGEETGLRARQESGGTLVRDAVGHDVVREVRQPVFSESEAKQRARALLNDHAKQFLTGEAECLGLPQLRPDRIVRLGNLGRLFSKFYYIEHPTHRADGAGYRTRVRVKDTGL